MGCDIHQLNIIIDAKTKKPRLIEGELPKGEATKFEAKYLAEFIPGRCYELFGILAGVRADEFQIADNVNYGIPKGLPEDIQKYLEDRDFHSHTWYRLEELQHELEWTEEKIDMYLKARAVQDPFFISGGEIDEYRALKRSVSEWIVMLDDTKQLLASEGHLEDYKESIVLFFFDS